MDTNTPYIGQRLSLKNQACTVRYIGTVADKQGTWLGVEWDDPSRGKNNGTHDGTSYFTCRSQSPTAASFLRPKQPWDSSRTFLQALREKYISPEEATNAEIVFISGKHAEEVGLEKFAKRQAQLQGIHTLVLERMCIRHVVADEDSDRVVRELCANITSLDLGGNLFECLDEVLRLCLLFPKLISLTLNGNRFDLARDAKPTISLPGIRSFSLSDTLLTPEEIAQATSAFPSLGTLVLENNQLTSWTIGPLPASIHTLSLSFNNITTLPSLTPLFTLPHLKTLYLKSNQINNHPQDSPSPTPLSLTLQTLDLRQNSIQTFHLPNTLPLLFPTLHHLHLAYNPLTTTLLDPSDAYMLLLARLPSVQTLNHSAVTSQERLNAETFYLNRLAREIAPLSKEEREGVLRDHPRWRVLCEEYGEPVALGERRKGEGEGWGREQLGARFVAVTFSCDRNGDGKGEEWTEDVPRSESVYALLGRVGKRFGVLPLGLRVVWETGERDPVGSGTGDGPEWWDSEDEDGDGEGEKEWVAREVELVAGTRMVGTYFEGMGARVRVEVR